MNDNSSVYDHEFWSRRDDAASQSAKACVPIISKLVTPSSVMDIGCGRGHWLREFASSGVHDILGVDSSAVLENSSLLIPAKDFLEHDLEKQLTLPRRFDLALCLEVAEHLPPKSALRLVDTLTRAADVVVFSAAIPRQGGVGHINERWPWYWRNEMEKRDFLQYDAIRHQIWHVAEIAVYYRQNMFLYVNKNARADLHLSLKPYRDSELTLVTNDHLYRMSAKQLFQRLSSKYKDLMSR